MKQLIKGCLGLSLLVSLCAQAAAPYFSIRSQSVNAARELVGWQQQINQADKDETYASLTLTPEYTRSFRPGDITRAIFGSCVSSDCKCPTITVSGAYNSDISPRTRGTGEWLSDYFGLPQDFKSTLKFSPRISNFNADINFYLGLDEVAQGLYFRIHAPITYTKWELGFCETKDVDGVTDHAAGYFGNAAVTRANLLKNATEFFVDGKKPNLGATVTMQELKYSKFATGCNTKTRLSDIEAALGWNFALDQDYHLGLALRGSAPTGNKPDYCTIFQPMVGSGGHWKLGGALTGHYTFWRSDDEEKSFGFWLDANVQHLFKACQNRSFDLVGKPNSRYMLAQKLKASAANTLHGGATSAAGVASTYVFADELAPVANLTSVQVKTSVAVEGDVVAKFAYTSGGFQWDLGYEFWGRSCEKICANCSNVFTDSNVWALKGNANVYGLTHTTGVPHPLAATESDATINKGTRTDTINTGIDKAALAWWGTIGAGAALENPAAAQTQTSIQPVVLKDSDIGYKDAQTKGMSHKVFTHLNYTWDREDSWKPFLGIGASGEFANNCSKNCSTSCDATSCSTSCDTSCSINGCDTTSCSSSCSTSCCQDCSLSQWAVWVKGGLTFN